MTDETAVAKLYKEEAEKAKSYKTTHDVERAHHLIAAAHLMRDYAAVSALSASFTRELRGMALKQEDLDTVEREEYAKKLQEAKAADIEAWNKQNEPKHAEDTKSTEDTSGTASYPSIAPSVPRRS